MPPASTVVILAAGEGTRMRSSLPKVLHPICGRPMLLWPLLAARAAGAGRAIGVDTPQRRPGAARAAGAGRVIVGDNPKHRLEEHLPTGVELAVQAAPRGTGDAVAAAL